MGCDLIFYLITASKYHKYLRPKLIEHYGGINRQRAEQSEKQRLRIAVLLKNLSKAEPLEALIGLTKEIQDGPARKYLRSGGSQNEELYQEIDKIFRNKTEQIYHTRNPFLRLDTYLQQIDSFQRQGYYLKVSNSINYKTIANTFKV